MLVEKNPKHIESLYGRQISSRNASASSFRYTNRAGRVSIHSFRRGEVLEWPNRAAC